MTIKAPFLARFEVPIDSPPSVDLVVYDEERMMLMRGNDEAFRVLAGAKETGTKTTAVQHETLDDD